MDPTDPENYTWAVGWEALADQSADPNDPAAEWQFAVMVMADQQQAIEQAAIFRTALEGNPTARNVGVYFTPPLEWTPYTPAEPAPTPEPEPEPPPTF